MTIREPGIYDMPMADYVGDPCPAPSLSSSTIHTLISMSPLHAWTRHPRLNPDYQREESETFDLGTACHAYLLEGRSDGFVVVDAKNWQTKLAQEARATARAEGKVPLLTDQWERVQAMATAVTGQLLHMEAPTPLTNGRAEETLVWMEGDVWCRARLDWLHADNRTVDDLKTAESANPETFSRTLWGYGYAVQAAWYLRGLSALFGPDDRRRFRFVACETRPPYACSLVSLSPEAIVLGEKQILYALDRWRECLDTNTWPGYPTRTAYAELPAWLENQWVAREEREIGIGR